MPFFLCEIDVKGEALRTGENIEALARHERYKAANEALESMCLHEAYPLSKGRIVTAHTADDRIENFYMRSIVGTGPGGFRGMLFENGKVVRPLLDCTRVELRDYINARALAADALDADGLSCGVTKYPVVKDDSGTLWREDATNAHTDRFRAYVRHAIVPKAREWNSGSDRALIRTMDLIADEDDMLDDFALDVLRKHVRRLDDIEFCEFDDFDASTFVIDGFVLQPEFGEIPHPLQRRCVHKLLKGMQGIEERIDAASVEAVLDAFCEGIPISGYVTNIQGDLAVSSNKRGVRVERMEEYRSRRKGHKA